MPKQEENFISGRLKSIKYAMNGIWLLLTTEASIKVQFVIALLITVIGFSVGLTSAEWIMQFLAIGLVLVAESANTAIEKLADFIHKDYHKDIGFIKDISAGAPAFAAIIAVIIGFIIYLPKFAQILF